VRILLCSGLYPPHVMGGAERSVHLLAGDLAARGHAVRVLTTAPYAGKSSLWGTVAHEHRVLVDRFYPANAYHLPEFREHGPVVRSLWQLVDLWNPHVWFKTLWIIRTWRPDVVHIHHLAGLSAAPATAASQAGVPLVATLHDHALFCVYGILRRPDGSMCPDPCGRCVAMQAANRCLTAGVRSVVGPSAYIVDQHRRRRFFKRAAEHVIPNGIKDVPPSVPTPRRRSGMGLHAVFIGQLAEYKGVHILLQALRLLQDPDVRISIAGDGPLLDQCRRSAACDGRLQVLGRIDATERTHLLQSADVLVLPSICPECLPTVIAEAQMVGLPVIATRLGGILEMVEQGTNGLLVEPGNAALLAGALQCLNVNVALWKHCAQGAQGSARRYDFNHFVTEIEVVYAEAIRGGP